MAKKGSKAEPKEVEDLEDDDDEMDDDDQGFGDGDGSVYSPGFEVANLGQRDLVQVLSQYDWPSGQYYIDLYRDRPYEWKGKDCHGFIDRVHRPIDIAWIERYHGGKTYHILIRGPHPKTGHENVIVGRVNSIVVGGEPKLGGRAGRQAAEEEEEGGASKVIQGQQSSYWDPVANKLVDATIDEAKMLRRHALQQRNQPSEFSVLLQQQSKSMELAQKRADAEAARQNQLMIELLRGRQDVGDPGESYRGIVDQMRRDMDQARSDHSRELREMGERHVQSLRDLEARHREQVERMRDDASAERDRFRTEADKREQRLRDEWRTREQSIRDTWEGRLAAQKEASDAREKSMQDMIKEQRERLRDLESRLQNLTSERDGAKLEAVRLTSVLATKQDPKPPLEALREVMAIGNEVAQLTGNAPTPETPIDQAMKLLSSEPAQRVAAGLQGWLTGMAGRVSSAPQPPAAGLQQWQQYVQTGGTSLPAPQANPPAITDGGGGGGGRVVRRRRRTTPEGEMEMPDYTEDEAEETAAPEGVPGNGAPQGAAPAPQPQSQPQPQGEPDAKQIVGLIEDSAQGDKPLDQFIDELGNLIGGPPVLQQIAVLDFNILVAGIEENSGESLSYGAKQLIKNAIPRLRERLAAAAAQA